VHEASLRTAINFGLPTPAADELPTWGINGKLSEFHAAIGLAVASSFTNQIIARRVIAARYIEALSGFSEVSMCQQPDDGVWQFFPLLLPNREVADAFEQSTRHQGMEIRRYYRPSLSAYRAVERVDECLVSQDLSHRMCCVPVYANASNGEADEMVAIVLSALQKVLVRS
jgi:dTDP-4-amino-4,6-dideoxygalactose transaminase